MLWGGCFLLLIEKPPPYCSFLFLVRGFGVALKECKECKNMVSSWQPSCPQCGLPSPAEKATSPTPASPTESIGIWESYTRWHSGLSTAAKAGIFFSLFVFGIGLMVNSGEQEKGSFNVTTTLSPEEKAAIEKENTAIEREKEISHAFSGWDGSHIDLARIVKESLNDPDSYQHVDTRYKDKGDTLFVVMEFRGKNVYGALIKNTIRANVDAKTGKVIEIVSQN